MDPQQSAAVEQLLAEHGIDAQHALDVLVQTLVRRHVDCELVKRGRKLVWQGQSRPNALTGAMDALHELSSRNASRDPALAGVQKLLMAILTDCQFAAEHTEGFDEEDEPDPPPMRLVRE